MKKSNNSKGRSPDAVTRRNRRTSAKSRGLGYVDLNKFDKNLDSHHIDIKHVIHIPKAVHMAIHHNNRNGENMEKMNHEAFKYMFENPETMHVNTITMLGLNLS